MFLWSTKNAENRYGTICDINLSFDLNGIDDVDGGNGE